MVLRSLRLLSKACTVAALVTSLMCFILHVTSDTGKDDLDDSARPLPSAREDGVGGWPSNQRHLFHIYDAQSSLPDRFKVVDLRVNKNSPIQHRDKNFNCTVSMTVPSFKICVYEPKQDKFISAGLLSSGLWEPYITQAFQIALNSHPHATVIDVGANIGYYSLLASAMGHKVIALEPQKANLLRFVAGAHADHWADNIVLLANALADSHKNISLSRNKDNQGGIRVVEKCSARWPWSRSDTEEAHSRCEIPTLTLDDLLYIVTTRTAVIKVDIEGYECRALATAHKFFSYIRVPYIFMEWRQMRERQHLASTACQTEQIRALSGFLADRGYSPHEIRSGIKLNPYSAPGWMVGDVYWRARDQDLLVPSL